MDRQSKKTGTTHHLIKCSKDVRYVCFFCKIEFLCEGSLSVHLTTLKHIGIPDKQFKRKPEFMCNICGSDIPVNNISRHQCIEKGFRNYWETVRFIDEFGSPNMCLLCRGLLFETPAHLNAHIIITHSWKEFDSDHKMKQSTSKKSKSSNNLRCPLCLSIFMTKDMLVLHRHVFDEHTPEMGITMLNSLSGFSRAKYGSPNDLKQWIAKRIYSCQFPNFRVKRYPVNNSKHINRLLPGFTTQVCLETFTNLYSLSAHLCTFHIVDEISKSLPHDTRSSVYLQRDEQYKRLCIVQQEIDLRRRNMLVKKIITEKISASTYCLECFRLYRTNFELQVHLMVFHSNMTWNICGICSYDCKNSLGLNSMAEVPEKGPLRSYALLWNALWNHERSHLLFFKEIAENPTTPMNINCLLEFSNELKPILEPVKILDCGVSVERERSSIPKSMFTLEQISALMELGVENTKKQTEFMINEALNGNVN